MTTTTPPTRRPRLRRALTGAALAPVVFAATFTGAYVAGTLYADHTTDRPPAPTRATLTDDTLRDARVAALFETHQCWTGEPPADLAGSIPPAALVTLPGGRVAYGPDQVGAALDHVFRGDHPALVVHGFCR